jgi:septal ring factor EnvC (AmiA/AmiB activator)
MNDKDYKKLAEAKDLKSLVKELYDLSCGAQTCLQTINFAPGLIREATKKDADNVAKERAKILSDQIQGKEQEIAKLQKELAELKKDLASISKDIATALDSKVNALATEADEIKKELPWVSGGQAFHFEPWQKYLKAKLK